MTFAKEFADTLSAAGLSINIEVRGGATQIKITHIDTGDVIFFGLVHAQRGQSVSHALNVIHDYLVTTQQLVPAHRLN